MIGFKPAHWLRMAAIAVALTAPAGALAQTSPALDQDLLPLFAQLPSEADLGKVKEAIAAAANGDNSTAEALAAGIVDPSARKLVRWYELYSGRQQNTPQEIEDFRRNNPSWPGTALRGRAEETLLVNGDPDQILAFFKSGKPETGAGKAAMAVALLGKGDLARATALAAESWRYERMSDAAETAVLARLGRLLTPQDHKYRADRLLYGDSEFEAVRTLRIGSVKRLLPHLTPADQSRIEARLAAYRCGRGLGCMAGAKKLFARLPVDANRDWGVFFDKARMLRKSGQGVLAWHMMLQASSDAKEIISPDDWWVERRLDAYGALYDHDYQSAYKLAAAHGAVSVNAMKEAEFLSGWIALRFLKDPKRAATHFKTMRDAADGPISQAQASYWLGRAYSALGDDKNAAARYTEAAGYFNTYYGEIARQTLDKTATRLLIAAIPPPPAEAARRFVANDAVRAAVIAGKAGLTDVMRIFLNDMKDRATDEPASVLAAHLALTMGDTQMALKIGKAGLEKGFTGVTRYAYPVVAMPVFEPLRTLPEKALLYAIARQESEFNTLTKSSAGARGILQIMPATARGVCGKYRVKCELGRLMTDAGYNARLASAYVGDTTDDFSGSYIMAIAGYNAGPGRVHDWVGKIGDPRQAGVDPIDWVEMLNLDETRDYVKKVLSNVQVYRAELEDPARALRIRADLTRGRAAADTAANN